MREFVHEPMKTRSIAMSSIAWPGRSPMYSSARVGGVPVVGVVVATTARARGR